MAQLGLTTASVCGRFAVENEKARERLEDLGAFATDALADSPLQRASELSQSFAKMLSRSMSAISSITSERDSDATPGQPLPAALPHQLARMRGREFGKLLGEQRQRLLRSFSGSGEDRGRAVGATRGISQGGCCEKFLITAALILALRLPGMLLLKDLLGFASSQAA